MYEDGIVSKKQLRELILLSMTQVDRIEQSDPEFPKRLRLGPHPTSRCGWCRRSIITWLQTRGNR